MRRGLFSLSIVGVLALTLALGVAYASHGGNYHLFGDAEIVSGGNPGNAVQIRSDADPGFGGISYVIPSGTTFGSLETLMTDFRLEADDLCILGSPRFQIGIDTTGDGVRDANIFAYFGIDSAGAPCVPGTWQNTGDFLQTGRLLDTSQLPGGTFYDPYDSALAKYGSFTVTGIQVVVDSRAGHPDGEQTALIDNTNVDGVIYTYDESAQPGQPTSKDDCKKGGWMTLAREDGTTFKNQGDCVSYTNTGK